MGDYTATVPAFVRTKAGTVRVAQGEQVPADTLPTEITRLVAGGVIAEAAPAPPADDPPPPAPPAPRAPSRGQSGTRKGR